MQLLLDLSPGLPGTPLPARPPPSPLPARRECFSGSSRSQQPVLPSQSGRDLQQYQSQAKQLFRKLNEQSPTRCTLEAGAMAFQ